MKKEMQMIRTKKYKTRILDQFSTAMVLLNEAADEKEQAIKNLRLIVL